MKKGLGKEQKMCSLEEATICLQAREKNREAEKVQKDWTDEEWDVM